MKFPTPPLVSAAILVLGLAGLLFGLAGPFAPSGTECGVPGMWKCLPGVVLAGRAGWIAAGAAIAGVAVLSLLAGRRPWATAAALIAGAAEVGVGGWLLLALVTGLIPLTHPDSQVVGSMVQTLSTIGAGVWFFAAAGSDRVMKGFRR